MKRSILALLLALPLASAAMAADTTPIFTDANGKSWLLDHPTATPIAPPPPAGLFGISGTGWDTNFELGIAGTSGNQDSFTVHSCLSTAHSDEAGSDKATLSYDHTLNDGHVSGLVPLHRAQRRGRQRQGHPVLRPHAQRRPCFRQPFRGR